MDEDVGRAISHDLAGPARRLAALLQLTQEKAGDLPPPADEYFELAVQEVATLQTLLASLQEYIRVDRHAAPHEEIHLSELLTRQAAPLGGRLIVDGDLPAVQLDPHHAKRIVEIVVDNVQAHAGPEARLTVKAEESNGQVLVHFVDDGPGISEKQGARIFRLFVPVRTSEGQTRLASGLAIAQRMARFNGGDIRLGDAGGGHFIWHIQRGPKA